MEGLQGDVVREQCSDTVSLLDGHVAGGVIH